jgi:hypothetical protein
MKYIDRVLAPNEQIVHETGLHWIVFLAPLACLAIASLAALSVKPNDVGAAGFVVTYFRRVWDIFLVQSPNRLADYRNRQ